MVGEHPVVFNRRRLTQATFQTSSLVFSGADAVAPDPEVEYPVVEVGFNRDTGGSDFQPDDA